MLVAKLGMIIMNNMREGEREREYAREREKGWRKREKGRVCEEKKGQQIFGKKVENIN